MKHAEFEQAITDRLVQYGYVQAPLVERARAFHQSRPMTFLRALLELKLATADVVGALVEEIAGTSVVDPSLLTVYPEYIETVSKLIPKELVTQALVFPVQSELNAIRVAMLNPTDRRLVSALEGISGCRVHPVAGLEQPLAAAISQHYGVSLNGVPAPALDADEALRLVDDLVRKRLEAPMETYSDPAVALVNRNRDKIKSDMGALTAIVRDPDIIRFVHQMLLRLVLEGASDVHFEPMEIAFRVRARIDGAMRTAWSFPTPVAIATIARLKVMAGVEMKPSSEPIDARISYDLIWGKDVDFRFSSLPSLFGEKIVLRALDRSRKRQGLTELGFDPECLRRVQEAAERPNGLLLVTGPTGSGKTSTLYALVDHLNREDVNIVSAEDPVESKIAGVTQVHCGEETGVTFADALRSFLRQDPDVILVGEVRDQETADIALKASLTGHLVMSTLHTNDAPSTILRLLNMNLDPFMVGSAVRLVLAQRLVRRLCVKCKKPAAPKPQGSFTESENAILKGAMLFEPGECEECGKTGYRGRRGIFEALAVTDELEELIARKASVVEIRELAIQQGMTTLRESGLGLAARGETSLDEVVANSVGEGPSG
ncbi:MAG: GspE/PulE family protein [Vicinamibacteria bacterium]